MACQVVQIDKVPDYSVVSDRILMYMLRKLMPASPSITLSLPFVILAQRLTLETTYLQL